MKVALNATFSETGSDFFAILYLLATFNCYENKRHTDAQRPDLIASIANTPALHRGRLNRHYVASLDADLQA